jgi:chorismate dehydratase
VNKETLRVGEINFTNCAHIYHYLKHRYKPEGISYHPGPPAVLNCMLRNAEIDLCLSSSFEYARNAGQYYVLPDYGIGSRGALPSIRLFSRVPLDDLDGARIGLTAESGTTVVLARIILQRLLGYRNEYTTLAADLERSMKSAEAMVLIGDKALAADSHAGADDLFSYDLSQIWEHNTGLPFVFALWILRKDAAEPHAARLAAFWNAVHQVHFDIEHPEPELVRSIVERKPFLTEDSLTAYWNTIAYRLSESHIQGLHLFYSLAAEEELIPRVPEFEVFHPENHFLPA